MQTFLPYKSFSKTAKCLDYRRLGKQRVECKTILNILTGKAKPGKNGKIAWSNHPAVLMWKGYEQALKFYYNAVLTEWVIRGYKNNMEFQEVTLSELVSPRWVGDERFHKSHQSNLLRKNFDYYKQFNWEVGPEMSYFWPTKEGYKEV